MHSGPPPHGVVTTGRPAAHRLLDDEAEAVAERRETASRSAPRNAAPSVALGRRAASAGTGPRTDRRTTSRAAAARRCAARRSGSPRASTPRADRAFPCAGRECRPTRPELPRPEPAVGRELRDRESVGPDDDRRVGRDALERPLRERRCDRDLRGQRELGVLSPLLPRRLAVRRADRRVGPALGLVVKDRLDRLVVRQRQIPDSLETLRARRGANVCEGAVLVGVDGGRLAGHGTPRDRRVVSDEERVVELEARCLSPSARAAMRAVSSTRGLPWSRRGGTPATIRFRSRAGAPRATPAIRPRQQSE